MTIKQLIYFTKTNKQKLFSMFMDTKRELIKIVEHCKEEKRKPNKQEQLMITELTNILLALDKMIDDFSSSLFSLSCVEQTIML